MRCSLLLGGLDRPYMDQLVRYMTMFTKYSFDITYLETIEECMTYEAMNRIHIVVFERNFMTHLVNHEAFEGLPMVVLEEAMVEEALGVCQVFKYQKASVIAERIFECFLKETRLESIEDQSTMTTVIGCFSPMGGSGNTTISLMIAMAKRLIGKRVFFLSLDLFLVYEEVFESTEAFNLSDYSTYLMTKDNWLVGLERMKAVDLHTGVEYLKTANHMQDLLDFQSDFYGQWIEAIRMYGDYDYIVIDFSKEAIINQLKFLRSCDLKVLVGRADGVGLYKWQRFLKDIRLSGEEDLLTDAVTIGNLSSGESRFCGEWDVMLEVEASMVKVGQEGWKINQNSDGFRKIEAMMDGI